MGRRHVLSESPDSVDLSALVEPDLGDVDLVARATIEAHRRGMEIRWTGATAQMRALIALCGLDEYLPLEAPERDPAPDG